MSCILCASERFEPLHVIAGHAIDRCAACGLFQLNPVPAANTIQSLYGDDYYAPGTGDGGYAGYMTQKPEYLATFREELRRIEAVKGQGSTLKILDVGCGPGFFIEAALARGHDVYGVDIIPSIVEIARKAYPDRVFLGALEDIDEVRNMRFDVVFASHVIEHVPDPLTFTKRLIPFLNEGGLIVYVTPNISSMLARISGRRWVSFKIPEHIAYYSPCTIRDLFTRAGLRTVAVQPAYQFYRVPFIAFRLRQLIRPLDRMIPRIEDSTFLRERIVRITSGSLRGIGSFDSGRPAASTAP
jgi:SAM-dependent methyltransferase